MKRLFIYIIMCLSATSVMAQENLDSLQRDSLRQAILSDTTLINTDTPLSLQEQIDSLLRDDMFLRSMVGIKIYDLSADTLVYAFNDRQTLRTGSTMKMVTAVTALDKLGGDYSFKTSLMCNGTLVKRKDKEKGKYRVFCGDITVRGGMDPCFDTDDMKAFVDALKEEKIDTIYGSILADMSLKDTLRLGSGWCWDDENPCLTPLLWNEEDDFLPALKDYLRQGGITVVSDSIAFDSLFLIDLSKGKVLQCHTLSERSHSIDHIMKRMMKKSDNLYAECMFYQLAAASGREYATANDAAVCINELVERVGLRPDDYAFADGSGLSLYNYQSPELQAELLRYAYQHKDIYQHLLPTLPIAGIDGTLSKRMRNASCKGSVKAKTGTVRGVSSLAGYVFCESGNVLCFSIINQGIRRSVLARNFQDKLCQVMYGYGMNQNKK